MHGLYFYMSRIYETAGEGEKKVEEGGFHLRGPEQNYLRPRRRTGLSFEFSMQLCTPCARNLCCARIAQTLNVQV
jgi:hypothetical protein